MLNIDDLLNQAEERLKDNPKNYEAFKIYALAKLLKKDENYNNKDEKIYSNEVLDKPIEINRTPKIDGDTEFEKILLELPQNKWICAISVMADFAETIKIINNKAYQLMILKLKELI